MIRPVAVTSVTSVTTVGTQSCFSARVLCCDKYNKRLKME